MAGTCKPTVTGLRPESNLYTVNDLINASNGATIVNPGLLNGVSVNEWNTKNVMYWYSAADCIDITFGETVNIWRSGTASWADNNSPLTISSWNGTSWTVVTSLYPQTVTNIGNGVWEKTITNLPAGRYKFSKGNGYRIDSEWFIESVNTFKHLFQVGDEIKTYLNSAWQVVSSPLSEDLFKTQGMSDIPVGSAINLLGSSYKVLTYCSDPAKTSPKCSQTAVSKDKLVMQSTDMSLLSIENINYIAVTDPGVKILISVDAGVTWKSWVNNAWTTVDISNNADIMSNGMNSAKLNSLTPNNYVDLIGTASGIRFAYFLSMTASADTINSDSISMNVDMKGKWKIAKDAEYDGFYVNKTTLDIALYVSGDYKINY